MASPLSSFGGGSFDRAAGAPSPVLLDLPADLASCNREWLCRHFLPAVAAGRTVGLRVFLRLLTVVTPLLAACPTCLDVAADPATPTLIIGPLRGHTDVAGVLAVAAARHPTLRVVFLGDYIDGGQNSVEALCVALASALALGADRVAVLRGRHEHLFPVPPRWSGAAEARLDADIRWRAVRFVAAGDHRDMRGDNVDDASNDGDAASSPTTVAATTAESATDSLLAAEAQLMREMEARVNACFVAMPLAAVVNGRFFCCSGGPSCRAPFAADVLHLDRTAEFRSPLGAIATDIVASEPADEDEDALAGKERVSYARNTEVGVGAVFTFPAACHFLEQNAMVTIVRGNMMPLHADPPLVSLAGRSSVGKWSAWDPGYRFGRAGPTGAPTTISLFSAPRLAGRAHNLGAVLWIKNGVASVHQFDADPRRGLQLPLTQKRSAFDWSLPMVVNHLMHAVTHMIAKPERAPRMLRPPTMTDDSTYSSSSDADDDALAGGGAARASTSMLLASRSHQQMVCPIPDMAEHKARLNRFRRLCRHEQRRHGGLAAVAQAARDGTWSADVHQHSPQSGGSNDGDESNNNTATSSPPNGKSTIGAPPPSNHHQQQQQQQHHRSALPPPVPQVIVASTTSPPQKR